MEVVSTTIEARAKAAGGGGGAGGADLALVPTMGALHAGHISLIQRAKQLAPRVAVSIFVNPTQFAPDEDFNRYPRPLERDVQICREAGVDWVFAPQVDQIYPPDELEVAIDVPALTGVLEGAHRPGHFIGVCRVVAKLLAITLPRFACFGQKDYQQLKVIEAMTRGLCLPTQIVSCPTLRDPDGLAMSSRNAYLTPQDRPRALALQKALALAQRLIGEGALAPEAIETAMRQELLAHNLRIDYATVRDARTLAPVDLINPELEPVVCLIAARLENVRLIDNVVIGP